MSGDEDQDRELTDQEEQLIAGLPAELITRIDDALLAKATHRFQKVARIIVEVMQSFSDRPSGIPDVYYAQRIAKLVEAGLLESQGNLRRMRFSEVRRPSPRLSASQVADLIAQRQYTYLGQLYEDGQGVRRDYLEALKWYRMDADRGAVWAQLAVGRFYKTATVSTKTMKKPASGSALLAVPLIRFPSHPGETKLSQGLPKNKEKRYGDASKHGSLTPCSSPLCRT